MKIDMYLKNRKTVFNAQLNWDDTVTVTMFVSNDRIANKHEISYKAGGKHQLYLTHVSVRKYNTKYTFKMLKGEFKAPITACTFVYNRITKLY